MNSTELLEMCRTNNYDTDKFATDNTVCTWVSKKHSYVESAYGELFKRFRLTKNILEIGVWNGGSHLLWRDYFPEATVVGIDIKHCEKLNQQSRIIEIVGDAYKHETLNLFKDCYFDIIIDDGPHTLDTMLFCVKNYLSKLSDNGIMCIEDIVEYSWLRQLSDAVPSELQKCIKVFDLRQTDEKTDSILMIIDKGELNG